MTSRPYPAVAAGGAAVQHKETMMRIEDRIVRTERVLTHLIQWLNIQLGQAAVDELIAALSDDEVYMPRPPIVRPQDDRQAAIVQHKETMMDDGNLKACPFCGGEGQIKWADGGSAMNWVQCQSCGAKGPWGRIGHDGSGVRNWNTRADLAAKTEANAAKRHDVEVRRKALEEAAQIADRQINLGEAVKTIRALIDKETGHE